MRAPLVHLRQQGELSLAEPDLYVDPLLATRASNDWEVTMVSR